MKNLTKTSIDKEKKLYTILGLLFIIVAWFIMSHIYNNDLIIPKIEEVCGAFLRIFAKKRIYTLICTMIIRILLTVFVSLIISLFLSTISFISRNAYNFISPIITIMKTVPVVAIIILLFMSIGMRITPYVATGFVIMPLMYEIIINSLLHIDNSVTEDIKTLTNINIRIILKFYFPMLLPTILTAMIQAFGLGMKVMLMTEFMSPMNDTFGAEIKRYYENHMMPEVFALVIITLILVLIIDKILKIIREKWYNIN